MKVLMTGMTLNQTGQTDRVQLRYCSNPSLLARAIRETGHELDWRAVIPGEDLGKYDCMIVGLANMLSFGSRFALGAIWAAGHSNTALLVDDWNVEAVDGSIKGTARGRVYDALMRPVLPRDCKSEAWGVIQELFGVLDEMSSETWKRPLLGSFFSWGDIKRFKTDTNVGEIWAFDPSCYQPVFNMGIPMPGTDAFFENKLRKWVLATLPNHDRWISQFSRRSWWDRLVIGHMKSGKPRYAESDVVKLYARSWGVMSPPYKHAGSGWWRARFQYAMDAGCILLAEPEEVRALGEPFTMPYAKMHEVEGMMSYELQDLHLRQKHAFAEWTWDEATLLQWVDGMLRRLAGHD